MASSLGVPAPKTVAGWKRLLFVSAGAGAGFALILALFIGAVLQYQLWRKPAKPWNTTAIRATFDSLGQAEMAEGVGKSGEPRNKGLVFWFVLENTTGSDYRLAEQSKVLLMTRVAKRDSLQSAWHYRLDYPLFVPSKQRVLIRIIDDSGGSPDKPMPDKEVDGFVLFDEHNRYQLNFPKGW
jgi:hypothetical protein